MDKGYEYHLSGKFPPEPLKKEYEERNKVGETELYKGRLSTFGGPIQDSYLMSRNDQQEYLQDHGYFKVTPEDKNYKLKKQLVKKAVGEEYVPIYQTSPDEFSNRDELVVLGNYIMDSGQDTDMDHAGSHPAVAYIVGTDEDPRIVTMEQDYNDYGMRTSGGGGAGRDYSFINQLIANTIDKIGSPVVQTTGFQFLREPSFNQHEKNTNQVLTLNELLNNPTSWKYPYQFRDLAEQFVKGHHLRNIDGKWVTTTDKDLIVTPNGNYWK